MTAHVNAGTDPQTLSDRDQTLADDDQSASDVDQTTTESDQTASSADQRASDRDQHAADRDQATLESHAGDEDEADAYASSRRDRDKSALERDLTSQARADTARLREVAAARRDTIASDRDIAARARDEFAAALDAEIERLELGGRLDDGVPPTGIDVLLRAAGDRKRAAASRARSAVQREAAARDRERAAQDRRQAALDLQAVTEELALEGVDHLTGAMRRRIGLRAIQRELDRTHRSGEDLVIAFVDVDGLKRINDTYGHAAGDQLLRDVAGAIKQHLRSYDVITRVGGDEFVCSLSGHSVAGARERFDRISESLAVDSQHPAAITVGLAERQAEEALGELIARADRAMLEARRRA